MTLGNSYILSIQALTFLFFPKELWCHFKWLFKINPYNGKLHGSVKIFLWITLYFNLFKCSTLFSEFLFVSKALYSCIYAWNQCDILMVDSVSFVYGDKVVWMKYFLNELIIACCWTLGACGSIILSNLALNQILSLSLNVLNSKLFWCDVNKCTSLYDCLHWQEQYSYCVCFAILEYSTIEEHCFLLYDNQKLIIIVIVFVVFHDVMQCNWEMVTNISEESLYFLPEDEGSAVLWNVCTHILNNLASHPRRL